MRSQHPLASRKSGVRRSGRTAKHSVRLAICLSLLGQSFLFAGPVEAQRAQRTRSSAPTQSAPAQTSQEAADPLRPTPERMTPAQSAVVNFKQLSRQQARAPQSNAPAVATRVPAPMTIQEVGEVGAPVSDSDEIPGAGGAGQYGEPSDYTGAPTPPSPSPVTSFEGQSDEPKVGTSSIVIPPDTMGAVGLTKVVTHLNNNYLVQNKQTGLQLSKVSIDTFWASTGATGVFDPRVVYDPYNNRWLVSAVSNAQAANSSVLVGISQTSDPEGTWNLFRFVVGCAPGATGCNAQGEWTDFPMLGFNKNWVAVSWNQFTINTGAFVAGKIIVLDYPALRTGAANGVTFTNASPATGFSMHPATTFSSSEETLFVPAHQSSASAIYRLHTITGTPAAPVLNLDGTARTRPGGAWTQPGGDIVPQQCVPNVVPGHTCPATPRSIDSGDAFIRSNVVFRNGKIWYPQTVALPAGGVILNSRLAAQWTALNPDGTFFDGGRIEDATATRTNGGKHYFYPSISVNRNNDVMVGFSEAQSDDYVDTGYAVRLSADAPGTMRDPVIYKEGEDYYEKTFGGTRNRWGDYSHTVIDPVDDRTFWTIQEYAKLRTGTTGTGSQDSKWGTFWASVRTPAGPGELIISEFRLRGQAGANDEFIEIFNASGASHTVLSSDGSAGYAIAASDGVIRCTIPNGTVIPNKGHYLCVNSVGYSLAGYPAGNGTTATGDATYTTGINDNAGIAIFNTANTANFSLATRLDAVGSTSEANTLYKEGAGYTAITPFSVDASLYRSFCPSNQPQFGSALGCTPVSGGLPKDTNNNAADFVWVDTNGTAAGFGQRLGAPGPENLSSPIERNSQMSFSLLDPGSGSGAPPNRVRDFTSDPANNATFGTLDIRRTVTNNTGGPVTRLRFRVIDITTFPAPGGFADLRPMTSGTIVVNIAGSNPACVGNTCTVIGTVLEEAFPNQQINGGGFNSSMSINTVTLGASIPPGGSVNVRFLLGIQQTGSFRFFLNTEVLP